MPRQLKNLTYMTEDKLKQLFCSWLFLLKQTLYGSHFVAAPIILSENSKGALKDWGTLVSARCKAYAQLP